MRGELQTARELGTQCLTLAQRLQDTPLLLQADHALGATLYMLGELVSAREYLEQGIALYDAQQHHTQTFIYGGHDPGVCCLVHTAWILWLMGYPTQALTKGYEALTLAQDLAHPYTLTHALAWMATLCQFRREAPAVTEQAEAVITLATEQRLISYKARGDILLGWALTQQGRREEGIAQMHQGLVTWRDAGSEVWRTHNLALLAEAYGGARQTEEGLSVLAEALASAHNTGARYYEAEIHRLKGELLLRQAISDTSQAEACFHQALDVARHQQAKSLELRAAMSLSRLWQQQGKRQEACRLLAPIYGWFTEGFDTTDLQEAKALLEELSA